MEAKSLLDDLHRRAQAVLMEAKSLCEKPESVVVHRAQPNSWNALECIEHLERYNRFYVPALARALDRAQPKSERHFKTGWLGNYMAISMLPKEKLNRMPAFKSKNPLGAPLQRDEVLAHFSRSQKELLAILDRARAYPLGAIRVPTTLGTWCRLKLGDVFRFVIYHQERHIAQMRKALSAAEHF